MRAENVPSSKYGLVRTHKMSDDKDCAINISNLIAITSTLVDYDNNT